MFSKIFFNVLFVILFPLEILSHYPKIDSSNWLLEEVQRHLDKVVRETLIV